MDHTPIQNRGANPSLVLMVIVGAVFVTNLWVAGITAPSAFWLSVIFVVQTVTIFVAYTIAHDGAHALVSANRTVNEACLTVCWALFLVSPFVYRRVHLAHHAKTNTEMDPDKFTASRFLAVRIVKSFGLVFHYYCYAARHLSQEPRMRVHLVLSPVVVLTLVVLAYGTGYFTVFALAWLLPAYVAMGCLAYLETALPHHPATSTSKVDHTAVVRAPRILELLMGYQNYHLVHHLEPKIPWYRIREYWRDHESRLLGQGARVVGLSSKEIEVDRAAPCDP